MRIAVVVIMPVFRSRSAFWKRSGRLGHELARPGRTDSTVPVDYPDSLENSGDSSRPGRPSAGFYYAVLVWEPA